MWDQLDPASKQMLLLSLGGRLLSGAQYQKGQNPWGGLGGAMLGTASDIGNIRDAAMRNRLDKLNLERTQLAIEDARSQRQQDEDNKRAWADIFMKHSDRGLGEIKPNIKPSSPGDVSVPLGGPRYLDQVPGDMFMPGQAYEQNRPVDQQAFHQDIIDQTLKQAALGGDYKTAYAMVKPEDAKDAKPDAKSVEIARYMSTLGLDEQTATKVAYGQHKLSMPDRDGFVAVIDNITGKAVSRVRIKGKDEPPPAPTGGLGDVGSTAAGVGPVSKVQELYNNIFGIWHDEIPFDEQAKSKQTIMNTNRDLVRALSLSSKFPVYEQQVLQKLFPNPDAMFRDPKVEIQKYEILLSDLRFKDQQLRDSLQYASPDQEKAIRDRLSQVIEGIALLTKGNKNPYLGMSDEELTAIDPATLTSEQLDHLIEALR